MSKSARNARKPWSHADISQLQQLALLNSPTRVIGLKLGRSPDAVQSRAVGERISLKPTNQSPYGTRK